MLKMPSNDTRTTPLKENETLWVGNWGSTKSPSQFGGIVEVVLLEQSKSYKSYGYLSFDRGILKGRRYKCIIHHDPRHGVLVGTYKVAGIKNFTMTMEISYKEEEIKIGKYTGPHDEGTWNASKSEKRILDEETSIDDGNALL